jgi:hypothetical protein
MNRHLPLAYVLAALESLAGILLTLGAMLLGQSILRTPRYVRPDDWLALAGLATAGIGLTVSGTVVLFHRLLRYRALRRVRIAALVSEGCLIGAGVGMWFVARQRGGDWVGIGLLAGLAFICVGILLLGLSLAGLKIIRALRPEDRFV